MTDNDEGPEWARARLLEYRRVTETRDDRVRAAWANGLNKFAIYELSGIARTTVDRILENSPEPGADPDADCGSDHLPGDWSAHTRAEWNARSRDLARRGFVLEAMARDRWAADPRNTFADELDPRARLG